MANDQNHIHTYHYGRNYQTKEYLVRLLPRKRQTQGTYCTTGINICPVVPLGKSKNATMKEAELQARLVVEELEKEAKGAPLNVDVIVSLTGNKSKSVLRNKRYIPGVKDEEEIWSHRMK